MTETDRAEPKLSAAYSAFSFVGAFGLLTAIVYGGYAAWPILPTVLVGAAAQTAHRVVKRNWKKALTRDMQEDSSANDEQDSRALILVGVIMIALSLFSYWVGSLAR